MKHLQEQYKGLIQVLLRKIIKSHIQSSSDYENKFSLYQFIFLQKTLIHLFYLQYRRVFFLNNSRQYLH